MLHKILVPLDGSSLAEAVLPHAVALARIIGAEITILRVVEQAHRMAPTQSIDPLSWHLQKAEAQAYLEGVTGRLRELNLTVHNTLLEGPAAERIIEFAHEYGADLIILGSHGQSGLSGWSVNSVAQKVILRAYTSIMLIPVYQPASPDIADLRYRHILAPLDGSQRSEFIVPILTELAQELGSKLSLVHVVARPEMPRRTPLSDEDRVLVERLMERNYEEVSRYLSQLAARLPGQVDTRVVVGGNVIAMLHEMAEDEAADLVILSAHGYSGHTRLPYGSVVTSFIVHGTTPLLIIQDVQHAIMEPTQAEVAASQVGNTIALRTAVNGKPAF